MPANHVELIMQPRACTVRDASGEEVDACEQLWAAIERKAMWPLSGFERLPDGKRVEDDSRRWTSHFLTDDANPHRPGQRARRTFLCASADWPDVLRHELSISYDDIVLDIQITETARWLRADIARRDFDLREMPEPRRAAAIAWMFARVLRLRGVHRAPDGRDAAHAWTFLHGRLDEGARFSTAAGVDQFTMWSWSDRVDGGVRGDHVYFLGFKHHQPLNGRMVVLDGDHWFDGRCWPAHGASRCRC